MLESAPSTSSAPAKKSTIPRLKCAKNDTPLMHKDEKETSASATSSGPRPAAEAPFRRANTDVTAGTPGTNKTSRSGRKAKKDGDVDFPPGDSEATNKSKADHRLRAVRSLSPQTHQASTSDRHLLDRSPSRSPTESARKQRLPPKQSSQSSARGTTRERRAREDRQKATTSAISSSDRRLRMARSVSPTRDRIVVTRVKDKNTSRSPPKGGVMNEEMNLSWSRNGGIQQRRQKAALGMRRTASADSIDYIPPSVRRARTRDTKVNASNNVNGGSSEMDVSIDEYESPSKFGSSILDESLVIEGDDSGNDGGEDANARRTKPGKKGGRKRMDGQDILIKQLERSLRLQDQMIEGLEEGTDVEADDAQKTRARHKGDRSRSPSRATTHANGVTAAKNSRTGFLTAPKLVAPKLVAPKIVAPKIVAPKVVTDTAAAANQASTRIAATALQTATKASEAASATATSAANALTGAATRAAASALYLMPAGSRDTAVRPSPTRDASLRTSTFGGKKPIQGPLLRPVDDDSSAF